LQALRFFVLRQSYASFAYFDRSNPSRQVRGLCALDSFHFLCAIDLMAILVLIRQLSKLFFSLVALMFVAAALFLAIEPHTFQNFHTAFYFAVVTMTTVGFGDLSCKTTEGRYAVVALIFASTIVIPLQAYLLSRVLSAKKSPHEGGYNPEQGMSSVVLIADSQVETVKVRAFIEEFFCRVCFITCNYRRFWY
jgi:hypothetical protein